MTEFYGITKRNGDAVGRAYVQHRVKDYLKKRCGIDSETRRDMLIRQTLYNDEWMTMHRGQTVSAICRQVARASSIFVERKVS
jgi:hypothetical protein